ncbi:MAG: hypothetical protein PHI55_12400 [Burkholderiaceae bacterium]|nr:hypothetical protein [Burkholderiaceae bacterium]
MKKTLISLIVLTAWTACTWAQDRIYRCGNEYTNSANLSKDRACKLIEGGNVTVVQGTRPAAVAPAAPAGAAAVSSPAGAPRVDGSEQRARDADARAILESELRKSETRHAELLREYNNGAPERNALDLRNPQVYMERTAALKASLARSESDLAGIRRELARMAPARP